MISKSLNFTFNVTVRPRELFSAQCRQTFSISGCSSATKASNSTTSLENVFSAPTDFRIRLARTSRLEDEARWHDAPLALDELAVIGRAWRRAGFSMRSLQKIVGATLDARDRGCRRGRRALPPAAGLAR